MYVITGATGNTGNRVAAALLDAGKKVRAVGRSAEKLEALKEKGADVFVGDLSDKAAMSKAFAGADQAYIMIPPDPQSNDLRAYQNEIIESLAYAIEANDLSHIVTLSSVGAENADGYGPINGLYDMEKRFSSIEGVNILHLHPGYFMENTLYLAGMLKNMGMLGGPVNPDVKFAMIATRDIAEYATKRLLALDFEGKSIQELQGERDVSYAEVAKVYGEAVGKSGLGFMQVLRLMPSVE